jgi:hypothetical protein
MLRSACTKMGLDPSDVMQNYVAKNLEAYGGPPRRPAVFEADAFYANFYNNVDQWGWAMALEGWNLPGYDCSLAIELEDKIEEVQAKLLIYLLDEGAVLIDTNRLIEIVSEMTSRASPVPSPAASPIRASPTLVSASPSTPVSVPTPRS